MDRQTHTHTHTTVWTSGWSGDLISVLLCMCGLMMALVPAAYQLLWLSQALEESIDRGFAHKGCVCACWRDEGVVLRKKLAVIESTGTDHVAYREERRFYGRAPKDYHHWRDVQRSLRKSSRRIRRKPGRIWHQGDPSKKVFQKGITGHQSWMFELIVYNPDRLY